MLKTRLQTVLGTVWFFDIDQVKNWLINKVLDGVENSV